MQTLKALGRDAMSDKWENGIERCFSCENRLSLCLCRVTLETTAFFKDHVKNVFFTSQGYLTRFSV